MNHIILTGVLACALCAVSYAEDDGTAKKGGSAASQTIVIEEATGAAPKHIDTNTSGKGVRYQDADREEGHYMPRYENYDANTGLPDEVPSDIAGQFD